MMLNVLASKGSLNVIKVEFYEALLKSLKSYGCMLNHLRAYYLIDEA